MILIAGLAVAGTICGCDRDDPHASAVRNGGNELRTVGAGGGPGMPNAQDKAFKAIQRDLSPIATHDSRTATAAITLVSQANLGMSDASLGAIADAESAVRHKVMEARLHLATWGSRSALAAAADSFDPSGDLAALRTQREELRSQIASAQQRLEGVQRQVTDLNAQAKQKLDSADAKYAEYNNLTREAMSKSATDALPLVERAHAAKREGDAFRLAGEKIQAEADRIFPQIAESRLYVEQYTNQIKSIDQSESDLVSQHQAAKKAAADARSEADAAASDLDAAVKAAEDIHARQTTAARDAALKNLSNASKNATKGAKDSAAAKVTLGTAKQQTADLHWSFAQSLMSFSRFLRDLSAATPKLPNASAYAAKADELAKQAETAIADARQAYSEAASAFGGVNVQGAKEAKDRLNAISEILKRASESADSAATDAAASAPAPLPDVTSKPERDTAASGPEAELLSALDSYLNASRSNKPSDMLAILDVPESAKENVKTLLEIADTFMKLDEACKAKAGGSFTDALKTMSGGAGAMGMNFASIDTERLKTLSTRDFTWAIQSGTAAASNAVIPQPITFRKVGGEWKVSEPQLVQAAAMAPMVAPIAGVAETLTAEVEAGRYKSPDEVAMAFQRKLMEMMGGGMAPKGMPGRGPGGG